MAFELVFLQKPVRLEIVEWRVFWRRRLVVASTIFLMWLLLFVVLLMLLSVMVLPLFINWRLVPVFLRRSAFIPPVSGLWCVVPLSTHRRQTGWATWRPTKLQAPVADAHNCHTNEHVCEEPHVLRLRVHDCLLPLNLSLEIHIVCRRSVARLRQIEVVLTYRIVGVTGVIHFHVKLFLKNSSEN